MDILSIEQLKVTTTIGVYDWERQIKQTLFFDLQWEVDAVKVAQTDHISSATDYVKVTEVLLGFAAENTFFLIETLAERAAQFLLSHFKFNWLKIKVTKPGVIRDAKNVSIAIERRFDVTSSNNRECAGYEN